MFVSVCVRACVRVGLRARVSVYQREKERDIRTKTDRYTKRQTINKTHNFQPSLQKTVAQKFTITKFNYPQKVQTCVRLVTYIYMTPEAAVF